MPRVAAVFIFRQLRARPAHGLALCEDELMAKIKESSLPQDAKDQLLLVLQEKASQFSKAIALAEGVSADAKGDIYAAGVSSMGLHKFVKQ